MATLWRRGARAIPLSSPSPTFDALPERRDLCCIQQSVIKLVPEIDHR